MIESKTPEEWNDSFSVLWVGPTNKQLATARRRIKGGEKESRVMNELLLEVLEENVRHWEERLANLTE